MIMGSISASDNISDLNLASDTDDNIYQEASELELDQDKLKSGIFEDNEIVADSDSNINFTSDVQEGIGNVTINFEGHSSDENVNEWVWDFGDGTNGSGQNINHYYSNFGSYNVSLTTKDSDGLILGSITKPYYVNVYLDIGNVFKNPNFVYPLTEKFNSAARATIPDDWIIDIDPDWYASPRSFNWANYYDDRHYNTAIIINTAASVAGNRWHANKELGFGQYLDFTNLETIYFQSYRGDLTNLNVAPIVTVCFGDYKVNFTCNSTKDSGVTYTFDVSNISGVQFFKIFIYGIFDSEGNLGPDEYNTDVLFSRFGGTYLPNTTTFDHVVNNIEEDNLNITFEGNFLSSTITNILWDFGDGTTSMELNPNHIIKYGDAVSLTIYDSNKTSFTYSKVIGPDLPKIGDKIYASIQDAIDDAEEGSIIDLNSDLVGSLQVNKTLTLNFNGYSIVGSSPVIQVLDGAKVTIKNITFEDSNVISTDDESSLTITESNISNADLILNNGNIAIDGNDFTGSFITIADANTIISNNNIANGGIKVNGGKSKINNNVLSGNDVAITQTEGESNITSNIITDNNIGVNITNGTSNINFNVIYNNTKVSIAYLGNVDASNNWFGVIQPTFTTISSDEYVDVYAPEDESQPDWLVLILNSSETTISSAQNYTISVDITFNSNGDNTSSLGVLPKFSLPVSTEIGKTSAVNVENSIGEFTLTTGTLTSDDVIFTINGEDYYLDVDVFKVEDRIKELEKQLAEAQANATDLASQLVDAQSNVTKLSDDLAVAKQNADNLTSQLSEAQKQIKELSSDLVSTNINANNLSIKSLNTGYIQVTLNDANGATLVNKTVNVIINGVVKEGITGDDGVAKIAVKYSSAGTYYATVTFAGDDSYKSSISTSKVVVSKKATKITAPKKTFKVKTKTKKVKITLKSGSTVLKSKKITLKVNGKTYTAKTNKKGVATVKVTKLTKKGTFKYTVKFAGDKAYKAISKKGKITVK